jgi:hypothetical protein
MMSTKKMMLGAALTAGLGMAGTANAGLILTGVGDPDGGSGDIVELYATTNIADLSIYGIEVASNGASASGVELALSGSASAGDYLYATTDDTDFQQFLGFAADFSTTPGHNGDDVILLYENASIIDAYGVVGTDGTGEAWENSDGWAYRKDGTGPSSTFNISDWTITPSSLGSSNDETNAGSSTPMPVGTYIPEPASLALLGLGGLMMLGRRRAR